VVVEKESEVARVSWYARDGGGVEGRQTDDGLSYLFQALEAFDLILQPNTSPRAGWY
jgi:hypothetical protein